MVKSQVGDVMFLERVVYGKVDLLMSQSLRVELGHVLINAQKGGGRLGRVRGRDILLIVS